MNNVMWTECYSVRHHGIRGLCAGLSMLIITALPGVVFAVNWAMLQGTEPPERAHLPWGFVQPSYTYDRSDDISVGPNSGKLAAPATVAPWFDTREKAHFRRFRLGVRGRITGALENSFTKKMNYFTLFELAPNPITYDPFGQRDKQVALDHLSVTFNQIPGARIRTGLFKVPGPEESWQGVINIDYIDFTSFIATQVLERFSKGNTRQSPSGGMNGSIGTPVSTGYGFSAVRDWGMMLFDEFRHNAWSFSYAAMVGRGEDIHTVDPVNDHPELYLYISAERDLAGGKGTKKNGIKWYAWHQQGERSFETDPMDRDYDRKRYGIGVRALGNLFGGSRKHRVAIELMGAEGMIFIGPVGGVKGGDLQFAAEDGNKAWGVTLDYGFFLTPEWELDLRLDRMGLLYETDDDVWASGDEKEFTAATTGLVYHFGPGSRLTFNYTHRSVDAPNTNHPVVENVTDSIGDRWALQWTRFF